MKTLALGLTSTIALLTFTSYASADPCTSSLPSPGSEFAGIVRYVGDGDGLCVGPSSNPATWIEVRLADFYAPELRDPDGPAAKASLERLVMGKLIRCRAGKRSYDRVIALCRLNGKKLGDLLRSVGVHEGGRGFRNH